ncbi:MAG: 4Fe-4S binding protein [Candidatus Aminicenantes bacterium]|nr:4Fe-4S binding protein [Candidatus Aminicenantes bacterium]
MACGTCVDVCYFNAREIRDGELVENLAQCSGCGLCADVCPMHCIMMSPRKEKDKSLKS